MTRPIGEIIRTLRKERNLTQEELAALLNITAQAVSKWENGTSMPDISQIVPLSTVFGVPTDVLFDTAGKSDNDAVWEIIEEAEKKTKDENGRVTKEGLYQAYLRGQEALKRYPANVLLLMFCLENGISLAYPENDCYDADHAEEIYREAIREAALVIACDRNVTNVLRAHMIMVLLHAANGRYELAKEHAAQFPWRSDMTVHVMSAYIAHAAGIYGEESFHCQVDTMYHLEAMLDDITQNGCARMLEGQFAEAVACFQAVFKLIETTFDGEEYLPPLQFREKGNVRLLLAEGYLGLQEPGLAVAEIGKAADYELTMRPHFTDDQMVQTPLLRDIGYTFYYNHRTYRGYLEQLIQALAEERFAPLRERADYQAWLTKLTEAYDQA